jgi:hypothetical protein
MVDADTHGGPAAAILARSLRGTRWKAPLARARGDGRQAALPEPTASRRWLPVRDSSNQSRTLRLRYTAAVSLARGRVCARAELSCLEWWLSAYALLHSCVDYCSCVHYNSLHIGRVPRLWPRPFRALAPAAHVGPGVQRGGEAVCRMRGRGTHRRACPRGDAPRRTGDTPRHYFVDTGADAGRPCAVIISPAILALRLLCFGGSL